MKYKIKNKSEAYTKYAKILFAPNEVKILELDNAYEHRDFHIEQIEEPKTKKMKGGK